MQLRAVLGFDKDTAYLWVGRFDACFHEGDCGFEVL
jgi:hypothetical protein